MPNVALRASSKASSASASSISVAAPAGTTTGDFVIVFVVCNVLPNITDNNGSTPFTRDLTLASGSTTETMALFSRRIQAGDPSSYSFNQNAGATRISAVALAFSDANATTPYDPATPVSGDCRITNNPGTSNAAKSITTTVANSIHVVACGIDANAAITPPGGSSVEQQQATQQGLSVCTFTIASPGATGTPSFSSSAVDSISYSRAICNGTVAGNINPFGGKLEKLLKGKL
jgi:hypothetical protein